MKRYLGSAGVAIVFFGLGVAFQRYADSRRAGTAQPARPPVTESAAVVVPAIQFDREPLWAYGFDTPAKQGDKAAPQAPPSRNLRPNQDPAEQTRPRQRRAGAARPTRSSTFATARMSSTGFPATIHADARHHRARPRPAGQHGPAAAARVTCQTGRGVRRTPPAAALPVAYFMRQIAGFPQRSAAHGRSAEAEHATP